MPSSAIGPTQFSRKNAMSVHQRNNQAAFTQPRDAQRNRSTSLLITRHQPDAECIQVEQESPVLGRGHPEHERESDQRKWRTSAALSS